MVRNFQDRLSTNSHYIPTPQRIELKNHKPLKAFLQMKILFIARKSLYSQPGGDTIQVDQTAQHLKAIGHEVYIHTNGNIEARQYDIFHFFNLIRPAAFLYYLQFDKPIIVSSIYVDYSEYESKNSSFTRKLILKVFGKFGMEYFKTIARYIKGSDDFPGFKYILKGQKWSIKKILEQTKELIVASHQEADLIKRDFNNLPSYSKIALGSEHFKISESDYPRKGICCIARIEGLKNQDQLIKVVQKSGDRLVLIGKAAANQSEYFKYCQRIAGPNTQFTGQLKGKEISKWLAQSKVHAMVSYYETTGLASIEALKAGCQIVISEKGGQKEIFGDHAFYADPDNQESIFAAIAKAKDSKLSHTEWVMKTFSWEKAASEISDIYSRIIHFK